MNNKILLALRVIKGNFSSYFTFILFNVCFFTLTILSIIIIQNVNGNIQNNIINSKENRTVNYFSYNSQADIDKIKEIPFVTEAEVIDEHSLSIVLNNVLSKETVNSHMSELGYTETVDLVKADATLAYDVAVKVFSIITAIIIAFTVIILILLILRLVQNQAKEFAIFKSMGYRSHQVFSLILIEQNILSLISYLIAFFVFVIITSTFLNSMLEPLFQVPFLITYNVKSIILIYFGIAGIAFLGCFVGIQKYNKLPIIELLTE